MSDARIKIPAELFATAESSRFEGELELEKLSVGADDLAFDAPLPWQVEVTNTDGALLVLGSVRARAKTQCARCLEDMDLDLDGEIEGWFLLSDEDVRPEDVDEDEIWILPADHIIDLQPLIQAALMLDMPNMPLCRPDCAGLCPQCGANLNEGACGCGEDPELAAFEKAANPFAALADFDFGTE